LLQSELLLRDVTIFKVFFAATERFLTFNSLFVALLIKTTHVFQKNQYESCQ
jgi:hypothetical protein